MKNSILAVLFSLSAFIGCGWHRVDPGEVGLRVNLTGGERGLQQEELGPGYYFVGLSQQFYEFPVYEQTYTWSHSPHEGSSSDESFTFQTKEGLPVNTDIGANFHIENGKVAEVFTKFRRDMDYLTHVYLHNVVRDQLNQVSSRMSVESVYGEGKSELIKEVEKGVRDTVAQNGIVVTNIFISGEFRLPEAIKTQISAKIAATQRALQTENEVQQSKAEAQKQVATAQGEAQKQIALANGEAAATLAKAIAQAKSNEALAKSITPQLLEWERLKIENNRVSKWNGSVPQIQAGGSGMGTLLNMSLPAVASGK